MASFKFILNSLTHWRNKNIKGGWMVPMESLGAPKVILGGLGLYKPSVPKDTTHIGYTLVCLHG